MTTGDWIFYGAMGVAFVVLLGGAITMKVRYARWEREELPRIQRDQREAIRKWRDQ